MPRDAGFVFAEFAADLSQGLLLGVIQAEAFLVARVEQTESDLNRARKQRQIPFAMRIWSWLRAGSVDGTSVLHGAARIVGQLRQAGAGADGVHMALREDRTKPGLQRTASVEIAEERALRALSFGQPVQFREKRVRQFAGVRRSCRTAKNRPGRGSKVLLICRNEVFPGRNPAFRASAGKRKILHVQCGKVIFQPAGSRGSAGKKPRYTPSKRGRKLVRRKAPCGSS